MREIGYDKPLFVQPFDHRGSFTKKFFGVTGAPRIEAGTDERSRILAAKTLIYRGLLRAIEMGVPQHEVGILVDAEFGSHVFTDAQKRGIPTAVCVEKSGQKQFDFEYGPRWQDHLRFLRPQIVKCLVRLNPNDDAATNLAQMVRLLALSDYIHATEDHYMMFELLVPAVTDEEKALGARYDREVRPGLMIEAIRQLQEFGIEPDIWKIEGLDRREDAIAVAAQTRAGGRDRVGNILLGRGSDKEQVHAWLRVAAPVPSFIGFAVGRTNFSAPLAAYLEDPSREAEAVQAIADNYKGCVDVWQEAAAG